MATPAAILEARDLTKYYASLPAVDQVSFVIRPGEVLGCVGPNGAGKSTIVKMLVGLLEPSQGEVLFEGRGIRHNLAAYKNRLGYVPEQADLYTFLTGLEYLDLVATLRGLRRQQFEEKASALLNEFALYPNRHSLIASYSKGMRQRIALIAALLHDPDILILDEPFNGLDVSTTLVVRKVVELLGAARKAIFFSSPVLEEVEKLCSRLLILKKGSVVASGPIDEICTAQARPDLEQAFLQVTDHKDADQVARNILAAVRERGL